ncbi:SDR family NAD(P)-dependent oxidoreductase [Paraburkholderia phenoliruptrix]|uniref:SDR family NAD(P)-dependent oxidoreductase n=1 Tax=Paraburkholderia phenoliruptrix TaxID=252970 RepID=UPI002865E195|nr:SDR family oxidoreductase [Paraburkholderia phenoliruptrix]MDR6393511.1 NAD(P)-dependent dehydrogenase (short-subunit alcohol dehydrogenase family) [Paraburkholderia phenoliruptrix]
MAEHKGFAESGTTASAGRGRLAGKTAIVSGGATGAGGAASRLFAKEGAKVAVIDINQSAGEQVVDQIRAEGGIAEFFAADVSKRVAVEDAVGSIASHFGRIDTLFNHAGSIVVKPFLETTDDDYDWLMDVNVRSMFMMTRAVLPHMLASGGGSIVCTASISSVAATPLEVLYCATKGACAMFARAIAVEYRDRGIRCNAVNPGFIDTPHGRREIDALAKYGFDASEAALAVQQGRLCAPEEVAHAALFLASDDASFINGAHLYVDNCFTAA